MELFQSGIRNGVSFKVLTNSLAATDEPLAHWGYMRYRRRMLQMGMQLYELSPTRASRDRGFGLMGSKSLGRLHAKVAVVDASRVFIGSMNFDPRSDALNTEIGIVIDAPQLAREALRLMNLDKLQSSYLVRVSPADQALEWVGIDDFKEVVRRQEPDADYLKRLYLQLVAPFVAESML
jgi:putative cardiolipin synthase